MLHETLHLVKHILLSPGLLVHSLRAKGVVDVGNSHHPPVYGDLRALQEYRLSIGTFFGRFTGQNINASGIAGTVPILVMGQCNNCGGFIHFRLFVEKEPCTQKGVGFHDLSFPLCESARLFQQYIGNCHLAHVVEHGRHPQYVTSLVHFF